MQWDLGLGGVGLLIGMSLGFGLIAHFVVKGTTRWLWLIAAAGYFVGGLVTSEVWFGWATQEELQPIIDGLSFDEVLLFGLVSGIVTVLVTRYVSRRIRRGSTDGDGPGRDRGRETRKSVAPNKSRRATRAEGKETPRCA